MGDVEELKEGLFRVKELVNKGRNDVVWTVRKGNGHPIYNQMIKSCTLVPELSNEQFTPYRS